METLHKPVVQEITPDSILIISKQNARTFHNTVKERIKENGFGLFEYLETIKFFEKLKEVISGNSQSKVPSEQEGDKEIKDMVRTEIARFGKEFKTGRGVKFELAETGTKYDFSKTGDTKIAEMEEAMNAIKKSIEARKEFLKTVPVSGLTVVDEETGETTTLYPPAKTSNSSYKITLPK